ncbi:MAG: hypothetical protein P5702_09300 [Limnospira sp. PMC 1291.21]|uniref:Uncharacterized protein n=2 Tax=Limnospira TaxID=2596745 RepID=B5VXB8_LIMMA|nr:MULTISPECIES: hypothetical protein [Limnospira]EKD08403.1 hypothetical protein SPLC1_S240710 [Arthrospira platensis C1]MDC0836357.1 hypothetical protein [Limnoraphis robusta]QJB25044.1 hypothetical protein HFV01_03495 [Limnospira fusiformis SAG 85.79]EDZ96123.1 conserved hypothetical protein [Limnospira maxima CS-328]MDT9177744.1 hypothetical protein [Limnospira sp. PMC 1238.20]
MEDFAGACLARKKDAEALLKLQDHNIAALHLGGISIECRLKSLLADYHSISEWDEKSRRKKDSMFNQQIHNPGHSLTTALRHMPELFKLAKSDQQLLKHLNCLIYPLGATSVDYIGLRYVDQASSIQRDEWKKSFDYVYGWLEKNEVRIG